MNLSGEVVIRPTRQGLVGNYLGHTAEKTSNYFRANRDKLVIVDQSMLDIGPEDSFGREALSELG